MAEYIPTVIVVDDEEIVLTSIESFLSLESDYNVVTFTSAKSALDYIGQKDVDLVISDYLMPEMDGISFLAEVRILRPEIPRVILTGYADKENAIKAINEVGLFQYIEKPWDNNDLLL
ncbi:response regulator, partial [bacterium]|nr:response regulator [bacterium]